MKKHKIGYTCGVFDLFHVGHLNLLERCKEYCDKLVVGICDDEYVRNIKHKEPVINQEDRTRIIGALKCVDEVLIVDTLETEDKMVIYEKVPFDIIFAGDDWKGSERWIKTEEQFKNLGMDITIQFFPYTQGVSTSNIRENMKKQ